LRLLFAFFQRPIFSLGGFWRLLARTLARDISRFLRKDRTRVPLFFSLFAFFVANVPKFRDRRSIDPSNAIRPANASVARAERDITTSR
jgi:hypothetical protein